MSSRKTIFVEGLEHSNPVPSAARMGPLLMSGLINGTDAGTGLLPGSLEEQCTNMFLNIRRVLDAGGGSPEHLVRLVVWLADRAKRGPLNEEWLKMFPDTSKTPARFSLQATELSPGILIQCEVTAFIE